VDFLKIRKNVKHFKRWKGTKMEYQEYNIKTIQNECVIVEE